MLCEKVNEIVGCMKNYAPHMVALCIYAHLSS